MKKLLIALGCLLCSFASHAQYPLEHTFQNASNVKMVLLTNYGYKYAAYDNMNYEIRLYDLNYNLWKTLPVPQYTGYNTGPSSALWLSDVLFNTNSNDIEFAMHYFSVSLPEKLEIIGENGVIIASYPDASTYFVLQDGNSNFKLAVKYDDSVDIRTLPGTIPCNSCSALVIAQNKGEQQMPAVSEPIPNPSSNNVSIMYHLPGEDRNATIAVYDIRGTEVKNFKLTNTDGRLDMDVSGLPSGNYIYRLVSESGISEKRKMTIVK
jgi:hypothetical protein